MTPPSQGSPNTTPSVSPRSSSSADGLRHRHTRQDSRTDAPVTTAAAPVYAGAPHDAFQEFYGQAFSNFCWHPCRQKSTTGYWQSPKSFAVMSGEGLNMSPCKLNVWKGGGSRTPKLWQNLKHICSLSFGCLWTTALQKPQKNGANCDTWFQRVKLFKSAKLRWEIKLVASYALQFWSRTFPLEIGCQILPLSLLTLCFSLVVRDTCNAVSNSEKRIHSLE